jgi:hypothetical protein
MNMAILRMRREAAAFRFLVLALLAVLVMAGCSNGAVLGNGQAADEPVVETSREAARSFVQKAVVAGRQGSGGDEVTLNVTQEEVSSFLDFASQVARQAAAQGVERLSDLERMDPQDLPEDARDLPALLAALRAEGDVPDVRLPDLRFWSRIYDPRVRFTAEGQMVLTGRVDLLGFRQPVRIVAVPRPEGDRILLTFVEGSIGRVPVPAWLAEQVVANVDALLLLGQDYADISDVTVTEGQMSVTGRLE